MNARIFLLIGTVLLAGCVAGRTDSGGSAMTDHGSMGHGMQRGDALSDSGFLPAQGMDISSLPAAKPSQRVEVKDGDTIELNPTIVRASIGGREFAAYGYDGQIPGPLLAVEQGASFTVKVRNDTDVPTTIHWHGVRLENRFDGAEGTTQEAIKPGKSFTYEVSVPDEGLFWYHPHVREDLQQDLGLYGGILVRSGGADGSAEANREEVLILDDMLLEGGLPVPYGRDGADHALMGRFGNTALVNGSAEPYALAVDEGAVVRLRLLNAANTRTFRLSIPGARMKLVGLDAGRAEREEFATSVTLSPSERATVDVHFAQAGDYSLLHESPVSSVVLGTVSVGSEPASPDLSRQFETIRMPGDVAADMAPLKKHLGREPDRTIRLTVDSAGAMGMMHGGMGGMDHGGSDSEGIEWEDAMPHMNAMATSADTKWKIRDAAGAENMDIRWSFKKGDVVKIRIVNDAESDHPMQHPIHLHGQRFLVASVDGKAPRALAWKDTVLVPKGSTVDILVPMENPGDWMLHCHIAEHLTSGMMSAFTVE